MEINWNYLESGAGGKMFIAMIIFKTQGLNVNIMFKRQKKAYN